MESDAVLGVFANYSRLVNRETCLCQDIAPGVGGRERKGTLQSLSVIAGYRYNNIFVIICIT